ncbi:DUF4071 domain-containing protein [Rhizobium leguminosarum]|uniref:DUF4071 domain-containing protein n=1 Tax=Rhizobium leguminosarum TaxID=384 RepID=UPI0021BBBFD4|nr:DUF4071 domain-containing protein [Rhizobium leguminosarum]
MPFGKKSVGGPIPIDFDAVYHDVIAPAIEAVGLEPIRADEEVAGGIIHKPMFERLVLCDYAVADLTTANANVFYELGVRHAAKPRSTVLLFAEGQGRLPFDVAQLRAIPYEINRKGLPGKVEEAIAALKDRLQAACDGDEHDSPLYQLLDNYPDIAHEKTDVFRERVAYADEFKRKLTQARAAKTLEAVKAIETELGDLKGQEAGVLIDLFLSYRSLSGWDDMIRLERQLGRVIANTVLVREQLALALNRVGRGEEAETVLQKLIEERGPSSETFGILGRVYKDRWTKARDQGDIAASGFLRQAVRAYRSGFEVDWRDAYPGVNAVTLLTIQDPNGEEAANLIPIVKFAVDRRIAARDADYWDHATLLELAVLTKDSAAAADALADALALVRETWEPETTFNNLGLIKRAFEEHGIETDWLDTIFSHLRKAMEATPV